MVLSLIQNNYNDLSSISLLSKICPFPPNLMTIFKSIAVPSVEIAEDQMAMINVLKDQKFNDIIPRFLPNDVEVAHKTGSITGLHHDAGIVYLPNGESYVLILLSKNLKDFGRFIIVGKHDREARNCIKTEELQDWVNKRIVEYWGESFNMPKIFSQSSIVAPAIASIFF